MAEEIKYIGSTAYAAHVRKIKDYYSGAITGDLTQLLTNSKTPIGAINELYEMLQSLGGTSSGGGVAKKMTTWEENFSNGISCVSNDSYGWYELEESSGRLSMILHEPDTTPALACAVFTLPSELDLTDGAYFSIDITSMSSGTAVNASSWNAYSCFAARLKDSGGNYSDWFEVGADGVGDNSNGIGGSSNTTVSVSKENISSYLGSIDKSSIVTLEITIVGWPTTKVTYKARDKGVYLDNIRLSRNTTETAAAGAATSGEGSSSGGGTTTKTYRRVASTYSFSTTDWNDAADIYQGVKTSDGDRLMIIVRHSERDSATGKSAGLNANGLSLLQNTAAPKLKGAPFANASTDAYYSTNVKRTVETAYFIGNARGASGCTSSSLLGSDWENETAVDHSGDTDSSVAAVKVTPGPHTYFNDHFTGGTDWGAARDYYKSNKDTCTTKCEEAINWLAEDSDGHAFTFVGSHDLCMVPFVCWAADNGDFFSTWNNDYDSNPSGWLMYMAGIAVIVHSDGSWEPYPVKCLDAGKFT